MSLADLALMVDLNDERYAWRAYGACLSHPEVDFFPTRGEDTAAAKAICAVCPVREICLEAALRNGEKFGIWGGLSERERQRVRRERGLNDDRRGAVGPVILRYLATRSPWTGTNEEMADDLDLTRQQVSNAVAELVKTERITREWVGGNKRYGVVYRIHLNEGTTP